MSLKQLGVNSEPIRVYEATPKAVASNIIFLAAWLAGTTGYFLVCGMSLISIDGMCPTSAHRAFLQRPSRNAFGGSPSLDEATLPDYRPRVCLSGPPAAPHVPYQQYHARCSRVKTLSGTCPSLLTPGQAVIFPSPSHCQV